MTQLTLMFSPDKSILLVIDVQGNLAENMAGKDSLFKHIQALIKLARILQIPILYTEQVPEKIGKTVPAISNELSGITPYIKSAFSCCQEEDFMKAVKALFRKEIIVCGIETHVCVVQTVFDLLKFSYKVQVVADAVSARKETDNILALKRIESMGATVTSTEMLATELLRTSAHEKFKDVLQLIK